MLKKNGFNKLNAIAAQKQHMLKLLKLILEETVFGWHHWHYPPKPTRTQDTSENDDNASLTPSED